MSMPTACIDNKAASPPLQRNATHLIASCLALLFLLMGCMPVMTLSRVTAASSTASCRGLGAAAAIVCVPRRSLLLLRALLLRGGF